MTHDAFICHASEDKDVVARPLAKALRHQNIDVWYDEFSLKIGDSLREAIDRGLASSRYAIVIISPNFFSKPWANRELSGIVAREMARGDRIILPIWHNVNIGDVIKFSPPLGDIRAINTEIGIDRVTAALVDIVRPENQPLISARAELEKYGWAPPPFSDEWWLDMTTLASDIAFEMFSHSFQFPPHHENPQTANERGKNIAWAALQAGWWQDAEEQRICQITHPELVLSFLRSNSELHDACLHAPLHLAGYTPQLLIPEFSAEFASHFDQALAHSLAEFQQGGPKWRSSEDDNALCDAKLALRHPSLGNHRASRVLDKWLRGHKGPYAADIFPQCDYLFWLLSIDSDWMPPHIRQTLIEGMKEYPYWSFAFGNEPTFTDEIRTTLHIRRRKPLKWSKSLFSSLTTSIENSKQRTGIKGEAHSIAERFIELDYVGHLDRWQYELDETRRRRSGRRIS